MAKQKGIIPIQGTIGNMTFYKSGDGFMIREKGGVSGKRIASDPTFQRTRENGQEFGRAGMNGKMLRSAFRTAIQQSSDRIMIGRLTRDLMRVIKTDAVNPRGQRTITDGNLLLLEGIEFNELAKLSTTLFAPYTTNVNRATGELTVQAADFSPASMIAAPAGATHFRFISAGAVIDFENKSFVNDLKQTGYIPVNAGSTGVISHVHSVTPGSTFPLFMVAGLEFYQEVNGVYYILRNGAFNSMALVKADKV